MRTWMLIALPTLALLSGWSGAETYFVAPDGNNAWSGTLPEAQQGQDGPWATLMGARENLRKLRAAGGLAKGVDLVVRGGTYVLDAPVTWEAQDGGTAEAPVVIRAYPGETPVLSGGRTIDGWKKDGVLWVADLPADQREWNFGALWVNGERRTVARTPDAGQYFYTAGKVEGDPNRAFKYTAGDLRAFGNLADAVVVVFHAWETGAYRVESLDEANGVVTFKKPGVWPFEQWGAKQRYYVENIREGLDQPGEWYLDRAAGKVYYMPMPGETPENVSIVAPVLKHLLVVDGKPTEGKFVDWVTFDGLTFAHSEFTIAPEGHYDAQAAVSVPPAVDWRGARFCTLRGCTVKHVGGYGVGLGDGCFDNLVQQNEVHDLGAGGIKVGGAFVPAGEMKTDPLFPTRNVVDNNYLHGGGRIFRSGVGAWISYANYITLTHNEIYDFYYSGVSNGWVWGYGENPTHHNLIAYNHIHKIGQGVLSDMGGIYNLGIQPGTLIDHNLIHDVYSTQYGGWGLYTDEGSSEIQLTNNVVYNTTTGGFHQHYGENNRVRNNIFAFAKETNIIVSRVEEHRSVIFERNIVLSNNGDILSPNWLKADVWLDYNTYWDANNVPMRFCGLSFADWRAQKGQDRRSQVADPMFVNPKAGDFRLHPDSPALALGFEPIDISRAGLYGPSSWTSRVVRE